MSIFEFLLEERPVTASARCNHCQAEPPERAKFCMECGHKLDVIHPLDQTATGRVKKVRKVRGLQPARSSSPANELPTVAPVTVSRRGKTTPMSQETSSTARQLPDQTKAAGTGTYGSPEGGQDPRTNAYGIRGRGLYSSAHLRRTGTIPSHPSDSDTKQDAGPSENEPQDAGPADASALLQPPTQTEPPNNGGPSRTASTLIYRPSHRGEETESPPNESDLRQPPDFNDEMTASDLFDLLNAAPAAPVLEPDADIDSDVNRNAPPSDDASHSAARPETLKESPTKVSSTGDTRDDVELLEETASDGHPSSWRPDIEQSAKDDGPPTDLPPDRPQPPPAKQADRPCDVRPVPSEAALSDTAFVREAHHHAGRSGDTVTKPTAERAIRQRREAAWTLFRERSEFAKAQLRGKQTPIPQKLPRILARHVRKLEQIESDRTENLIAQLEVIASTGVPGAVEPLRSLADRRQIPIRVAIAEGLGRIRHETSGIALLDLLSDGAPEVAHQAVRSLLKLRYEETVAPLLALGIADGRCRAVLRETIQQLDEQQQEELADPLQAELQEDQHPDIAAFALHLLALIKGEKLIKTYIRLTRHKAPEVRVATIDALSHTGKNRVIRYINAAMKDPVPSVRATAAAALSRMTSPNSLSLLIQGLHDAEASVRRSVAKTLVGIQDEQASAAASKALNSETDATVIQHLLEIVGRCGTDDALRTLERYLQADDKELRHRAMSTLRKLRNPRGVDLLYPFLDADDADTRRITVEAVGQLKSGSVLPKLRAILKEDAEETVRAAAARSLGELGDKEGLPLLEEALHDGRSVKCQAVIAMGQIGHKAAVPALLALLRDQAPEIRYHASTALAEIGDLPNPEPLRDLLDDREALVRRGAEAALTKLGHGFQSAKWIGRARKLASGLVPSTVAGAIPGGTTALLAMVALLAIGAVSLSMASLDFSSQPEFRIRNVTSVALSSDGNRLAVARQQQVYELWNLQNSEMSRRFQHSEQAEVLMYSGNRLLASTPGKIMEVSLDAATEESGFTTVSEQTIHRNFHRVFNDGKSLVTCNRRGQVQVLSLESPGADGTSFAVRQFDPESTMAIMPDGSLLICIAPGGAMRVINTEDGREIGSINLNDMTDNQKILCCDVDQSGSYLALGTFGGTVLVIDLNDGLKIVGKPFAKGMNSLGVLGLRFVNGSRRIVLVTGQRKASICSEDFQSSQELKTTLPVAPDIVSFSDDGMTVAIAEDDSKHFAVVNLADDQLVLDSRTEN